MWDSCWDTIFRDNEWGKYPSIDLVRFIARNYYKVKNRSHVKILEVGCGTGANIWYLAREGFSATGLDGSKIGIEKASKRLKDENLKACFKVADVMKIPSEDNHFDCVVDIECIYANSYNDSKKIMDEIFRVLKPGGLFFSQTFKDGCTGDGTGKKLPGEKNTYLEMSGEVLRSNSGIIRLTSKEELMDLYKNFDIKTIDEMFHTEENGKFKVKEWIVICSKPI
jgi:ubiquinone/menaquinone biosynthesis C-methylase UbiE